MSDESISNLHDGRIQNQAINRYKVQTTYLVICVEYECWMLIEALQLCNMLQFSLTLLLMTFGSRCPQGSTRAMNVLRRDVLTNLFFSQKGASIRQFF